MQWCFERLVHVSIHSNSSQTMAINMSEHSSKGSGRSCGLRLTSRCGGSALAPSGGAGGCWTGGWWSRWSWALHRDCAGPGCPGRSLASGCCPMVRWSWAWVWNSRRVQMSLYRAAWRTMMHRHRGDSSGEEWRCLSHWNWTNHHQSGWNRSLYISKAWLNGTSVNGVSISQVSQWCVRKV